MVRTIFNKTSKPRGQAVQRSHWKKTPPQVSSETLQAPVSMSNNIHISTFRRRQIWPVWQEKAWIYQAAFEQTVRLGQMRPKRVTHSASFGKNQTQHMSTHITICQRGLVEG